VCFESHPSNVFIARDSLMPLYKLLKLDVAFGISFPDWFDLVQHAADESVLSLSSFVYSTLNEIFILMLLCHRVDSI
jgi:hypothetical protein